MAILDSTGAVVAKYVYDAWGDLVSVKDANGNGITANTHVARLNPFRYRGYMYDEETGFYYVSSRYYDPKIGRWLNADELVSTGTGLSGFNMFAYCNDNPVMLVDSNGNIPISYDPWVTGGPSQASASPKPAQPVKITPYNYPDSESVTQTEGPVFPIDNGITKNDYPQYKGNTGGFHGARDIEAPIGTPVYAAFSGVVIASDPHWSYGENVVIKSIINGKEYITIYAHLAEGSSIAWDVGQTVFAGEQIGCVGLTGNTDGAHLHFEMREYPFRWGSGGPDDYDGDHIDPFSFFGG